MNNNIIKMVYKDDFFFSLAFGLSNSLFFLPVFFRIMYVDFLKYLFYLNLHYGGMILFFLAISLILYFYYEKEFNILLIYKKYALKLWAIWLFIFVMCSFVSIFFEISANKTLKPKDISIIIDGELKEGQWHRITADMHRPNGSIASMIDYKYNEAGDIDYEVKYNEDGTINYILDYIYDQKGRLIEKKSLQQYGESHFDATYEYDDIGRCIFEHTGERNNSNADYSKEYLYDANNLVKRIIGRYGDKLQSYQINKYRYDRQLKRKEVYSSGNSRPFVTKYYYNYKGILIREEYDERTITNYFYDDYNNLIREEASYEGNDQYYIEYSYEFF